MGTNKTLNTDTFYAVYNQNRLMHVQFTSCVYRVILGLLRDDYICQKLMYWHCSHSLLNKLVCCITFMKINTSKLAEISCRLHNSFAKVHLRPFQTSTNELFHESSSAFNR